MPSQRGDLLDICSELLIIIGLFFLGKEKHVIFIFGSSFFLQEKFVSVNRSLFLLTQEHSQRSRKGFKSFSNRQNLWDTSNTLSLDVFIFQVNWARLILSIFVLSYLYSELLISSCRRRSGDQTTLNIYILYISFDFLLMIFQNLFCYLPHDN